MTEIQVAPPKTVFQKDLKAPFYKLRFIGGSLGKTYRNADFESNAEINDILFVGEKRDYKLLRDHNNQPGKIADAFVNLGKGEDMDLEDIQKERKVFLEGQKKAVLGDVGEDKEVTPETETIAVTSASNNQLKEYIKNAGLELPKDVKSRAEIEAFLKKKKITEIEV